jgi:PKD domain
MRPLGSAPRGRPRSASTGDAPSFLAALTAVFVLAGCSGSDATGPELTSQPDQAPQIAGLSVTKAGDVYLRGSLSAAVSDPEGKMQEVVIDWGDGSSLTVTSDFGAVSKTHDYKAAGTYPVVVTATDAAGNRATGTGSLKLDPVPHACIDVKIVGACLDVHPDFQGVDIDIRVLDNSIYKFNLSTTKSRVEVILPVGGVLGQVKVVAMSSFSMKKNASYVRFQIFGCTLFAICTNALDDQKFTW